MKALLGLLLMLPLVAWAGYRGVADIQYGRNCSGHLKRAADANTIELATSELKVAIAYAEAHGMTDGYTSVLYRTPDEDVGFWFKNLTASLGELEQVAPETTRLERSNLLMKLRETLLDQGKDGQNITEPPGISVFPFNVAIAWWGWLSLLSGLVGVVLIALEIEEM